MANSTLVAGNLSSIYGAGATGWIDPALGAGTFGSLTPQSVGGVTSLVVASGVSSFPGQVALSFSGDQVAALGARALLIDGVSHAFVSSSYDSGGNSTAAYYTRAAPFVVGEDYLLDLEAGAAYAGPTYVGVSTGAGSATAASIDFSSSGRAAGDPMFVAVMTANQAATVSGFTEVATYSPQSRGTAGVAGGVRLTLFSKVSDGTETTVSTSDSGDIQYAAGLVVRGAAGASVAVDIGAGNNVAATTAGSFGGVTTTGNDRLIVHFVATDRDATGASWGAPTNVNLANLTERFDNGVATGSGGGIGIWTGEKQAAGATGNTTSTQAASAAYCWITLALKNAAGGTGGSASGTSTTVTLSSTAGTRSGSASRAGSATGIALSAVSGTFAGAAVAAGSATALVLSAVAGVAASSADGSASGTSLSIALNGISGTANGNGAASGSTTIPNVSAVAGQPAGEGRAAGGASGVGVATLAGVAGAGANAAGAATVLGLSGATAAATGGAAALPSTLSITLAHTAGSSTNAADGATLGTSSAIGLAHGSGQVEAAARATGSLTSLALVSAPAPVSGSATAVGRALSLTFIKFTGEASGEAPAPVIASSGWSGQAPVRVFARHAPRRAFAALAVPRIFAADVARDQFAGTAPTRQFIGRSRGKNSVINFPNKFAGEVRNATVDFARLLASGETLTGTPTVTVSEGSVSLSNKAVASTVVSFRISGGTAGRQALTISAQTSADQTVEEVARFMVV